MNKKIVAVTGANSYLGSAFVRHLIKNTDWHILSFVSPRCRMPICSNSESRVQQIQVDLAFPIAFEIQEKLGQCEAIFHFAWVRGVQYERVKNLNFKMIANLLNAANHSERLFFISSVAACPNAKSIYARVKYEVMKLVAERKGVSLVVGLVVDRIPQGPYKMLVNFIKRIPVSLRFIDKEEPSVYPIDFQDLMEILKGAILKILEPGNYRVFGEEIGLNQFLSMIEEVYPKRRLKLKVKSDWILWLTSLLKALHLGPVKLFDRIQTFLWKDSEFLFSHREIQNSHVRSIGEIISKVRKTEIEA